jgi:hypothetical protein
MCFQLGVSEDCARNLKPAIPLIGLMTHRMEDNVDHPFESKVKTS